MLANSAGAKTKAETCFTFFLWFWFWLLQLKTFVRIHLVLSMDLVIDRFVTRRTTWIHTKSLYIVGFLVSTRIAHAQQQQPCEAFLNVFRMRIRVWSSSEGGDGVDVVADAAAEAVIVDRRVGFVFLWLYFLNQCLECQPRAHTWIRYTRTWIWIASMEMQMWLLADTFRDLLYSASSINSPAFQTNRRQDANQAKYICFCLRCFFWRLDSFNLINCQHVPRLFISHSIQTQSQAAYSNIRIRLTKE